MAKHITDILTLKGLLSAEQAQEARQKAREEKRSVEDILYDPEPDFIKVVSRPAAVDDSGCQHQECYWDIEYQCERCRVSSGSTCSWASCSSCANGRCSLIE